MPACRGKCPQAFGGVCRRCVVRWVEPVIQIDFDGQSADDGCFSDRVDSMAGLYMVLGSSRFDGAQVNVLFL